VALDFLIYLLGQFIGSIYRVNLSGQFIGSIYRVNLSGQTSGSMFLYLCFFGKDYPTIGSVEFGSLEFGSLEFGSLEFGSSEFNLLESPSAYCEFPPSFREQVASRAQQE